MTKPDFDLVKAAALRCKYEDIHEAQQRILNSKLEHGTGSPEHAKAVAWAESFGPALVVDYLTLRGEIARLMTIVNAAVYLYDNRLGWSDGRNPYAPPVFWDELGRTLGRDPAGFCTTDTDAEPRNDSDTCECGNRKPTTTDFCRACAVADEREE